ncbi:MAG: SET domain-containing protein-lysine N-methyltransferase [Bacteroidales bacterium]|nr:SET domain-containing protein-lysine N-methyltransferase [Bacteroidales bacterium]MBN2818119.1 SET domain-containing protein-lysine N-methyltransferase [Bacteroidales bacterium]
MIHPSTELRHISDAIGNGVFATKFIPEGTLVYVKDALEITISREEFKNHIPEMQVIIDKYSYVDENGNLILSWDIGKFVNHCCNFNTISTGYGFEIAVRDIFPGEEITDEYGVFNLESEMYLCCKHKNCRGILKPSDFDDNYQKWDKIIQKSLKKVFEVEQPLFPFLEGNTLEELKLYIKNPKNYKSVYSLRYKKEAAESIEVTSVTNTLI